MANTTFNGPVRSENGFQSITKSATTGAVTVNGTFGATTSVTNLTTTNLVFTDQNHPSKAAINATATPLLKSQPLMVASNPFLIPSLLSLINSITYTFFILLILATLYPLSVLPIITPHSPTLRIIIPFSSISAFE